MANGKPGRPRRYDYDAAFAYYVTLGPARSLAAVREEFGMGYRALERACSKDRWVERAHAIDAEAAKRAEKKLIRERTERIADTLRIIDAARAKFASQLRLSDFRLTGSDFVGLMKIEALLEGPPTESHEVFTLEAIDAEIARLSAELGQTAA
ncbi:MAG: hypothetical protein ABSC51_06365 [Gaiellaceae bacterium]|jgi:hypothetical protein